MCVCVCGGGGVIPLTMNVKQGHLRIDQIPISIIHGQGTTSPGFLVIHTNCGINPVFHNWHLFALGEGIAEPRMYLDIFLNIR